MRCTTLVKGRYCRNPVTRRGHYGCCWQHTVTVYKCTRHAKKDRHIDKWVDMHGNDVPKKGTQSDGEVGK